MSEAQILEKLPLLTGSQRKELIHRLSAREQGISYEAFCAQMAEELSSSLREASPVYAGVNMGEVVHAMAYLSQVEVADLLDHACALDENLPVEEFRERHALLEEALNDPHPGYTLEEVREYLQKRRV